jgi:hypothetical protein
VAVQHPGNARRCGADGMGEIALRDTAPEEFDFEHDQHFLAFQDTLFHTEHEVARDI